MHAVVTLFTVFVVPAEAEAEAVEVEANCHGARTAQEKERASISTREHEQGLQY